MARFVITVAIICVAIVGARISYAIGYELGKSKPVAQQTNSQYNKDNNLGD